MLSLVDTDWLVEENELLTIAKLAEAVVSILAVDSRLVVLVLSDPDALA